MMCPGGTPPGKPTFTPAGCTTTTTTPPPPPCACSVGLCGFGGNGVQPSVYVHATNGTILGCIGFTGFWDSAQSYNPSYPANSCMWDWEGTGTMFAIWQDKTTGVYSVIGTFGNSFAPPYGTANITCVGGILNGSWQQNPPATTVPGSGDWIVDLNAPQCYGTCYYTWGSMCTGPDWSDPFLMDQQCYGSPPGPLNTWTDYGGFAQYVKAGSSCGVYCACSTPPAAPSKPTFACP